MGASESFRAATGRMLRRARLKAGFTLKEVQERSEGRFSVSAVGTYERGERAITLERFCELVSFYEMPPERVLSRVLDAIPLSLKSRYVIDLTSPTASSRHEP